MKLTLCIASFCTLLLQTVPAHAQDRSSAHIIIAADHSVSMYLSGHMRMQTRSLITAMDNYMETCRDVRMTYLPWGTTVGDMHTFMLNDQQERAEFQLLLDSDQNTQAFGGTKHLYGLHGALHLFELYDSDFKLLVFITDQSGRGVNEIMPAQVQLYKIALGDGQVRSYMKNSFMPEAGYPFHARTDIELTELLDHALKITDVGCLG